MYPLKINIISQIYPHVSKYSLKMWFLMAIQHHIILIPQYTLCGYHNYTIPFSVFILLFVYF